jgi:hypothetical protein
MLSFLQVSRSKPFMHFSSPHKCHMLTFTSSSLIWSCESHVVGYTGRFIMFSVITNIYNETEGPTLMELFTATVKLKKFLLQLEIFDACTTGDTAHIDTILKFLPHTRQYGCIDILHCCNDPCLYVSEVTWQWWDEYFARNARCTVTTDLLVWYSNTKNDFSPGAAIFLLHTLASPSGSNVNYDKNNFLGKKMFWVVPYVRTGFVNTCPTVFLS